MNNDLEKLIERLPFFISNCINSHISKSHLIEIILDLGRRPEARFQTGTELLSKKKISWQDLEYITKRINKFNNENRAGIENTLHRISCFRNRQFIINGLTCRVGRSIFGTISIIRDLLESHQSILILGKPGVGKTTIIREIARVFSDELEKRVIIIDTSNEIAGDSDIPHLGIGRARRMQVTKTEYQHKIMTEAIENHMPEVIIIDEISTELEVLAAQTIAKKGVQLIGTTHGDYLENLINSPLLNKLLGKVSSVILSDEEAKRRNTKKSILERKAYPTFEILIEINSQTSWNIHENVKKSIDFLLTSNNSIKQIRSFSLAEKVLIRTEQIQLKKNSFFKNPFYLTKNNWNVRNKIKQPKLIKLKSKILIIYPYSLSNNLLRDVLLKMKISFIFTNEIKNASIIIGLKKHIRKNPNLTIIADKLKTPLYTINSINYYQLTKLFSKIT